MNHGSLFSGIGGFDLAAEWMGWRNEFHCEWMPFPRKVLSHYFPNSISYEDITKTDFSVHRGAIDILTGGFPCQPYSSAGKRLGKEDERHLWPHMLRVISEVKPTYVVGENVRGLTNWNGGMVFEEVCVDLESQGYEVQPILLPACSVGAPHRRDRIWFVAYSKSNGDYRTSSKTSGKIRRQDREEIKQSSIGSEIWTATNSCSNGLYDKSKRISQWKDTEFEQRDSTSERLGIERTATNSNGSMFRTEKYGSIRCENGKNETERTQRVYNAVGSNGNSGTTSNSDSIRQHERECDNEEFTSEGRLNALNDINTNDESGNVTDTNCFGYECRKKRQSTERKSQSINEQPQRRNKFYRANFEMFPTQSPICGGDDGLPTELDGITFSKWRQESIKGYGNAIVPQVAYQIFKVIAEMDAREKAQLKLF